jgi:hypothetical protein
MGGLGLILDLPLLEGSGLIAKDISGLGSHMTLKGVPTPSWVSGRRGGDYALSFDGLNTYGEVKSLASPPAKMFSLRQCPMTIEIGFKPDASLSAADPDGTLFDHYILAKDKGWYVEFETDTGGGLQKCEFGCFDGSGNQSYTLSNAFTNRLGVWHDLVCRITRTASWVRNVIIDGVLEGTETRGFTFNNNVDTEYYVGAGASVPAEVFKGLIDYIRVWDYDLSDEVLEAHRLGGRLVQVRSLENVR